jgi:hypothetical protein
MIVHEVSEISPKDFFEGLAASAEAQKQGASPVVFWVEGVAFIPVMLPDTEAVVADKLQGVLHYGLVQFTRTSYQAEKKATVAGRDHMIKMLKGENNPDLVNLAKFLNARPPLPSS